MTTFGANMRRAARVLEALYQAGTRTVVLSSGARNAPIAKTLFGATEFQTIQHFEDRSAAFFALGMAKRQKGPVAVVTTSGTAAAELLPAAVEAYYSGISLALVTADRPASYRGTGAPQSIEQVGLFGPYAAPCFDLDGDDTCSLKEWQRQGPVHINVCFDEPLLDGPAERLQPVSLSLQPESSTIYPPASTPQKGQGSLARFLEKSRRPMAIVGELEVSEAKRVLSALVKLAAPIYAEGLSGLRGESCIGHLLIRAGDRFVRRAFDDGDLDGVIRFGGVPTLRTWRDLDGSLGHVPVLSLTNRPFTGLRDNGDLQEMSALGDLSSGSATESFAEVSNALRQKERPILDELEALFKAFPTSEPSMVRALSEKMNGNTFVYLGNSMPIRTWDLAARPDTSPRLIAGNRGANGIDGQVSTFLGMCRPQEQNLAIMGDLTTLYDAQGLFIASVLDKSIDFTVGVINNGGGRIFGHVFDDDRFQNRHSYRFKHIAAQWAIEYEEWREIPDTPLRGGRRLVEICPDQDQTDRFYEAYSRLGRSA